MAIFALAAWASFVQAGAAAETGEVSIREVLPLDATQRAQLAEIVESDPDARRLFEPRLAEAEAALEKSPRPLAAIRYEGLVHTDPGRIADVQNLQDMDDAAALFEAWQVTGRDDFARHSLRYLTEWAAVYEPTGNDVNENKLTPLFVIYEALGDRLDENQTRQVQEWLGEIARLNVEAGKASSDAQLTNRFTKRLRISAVIGLGLDRDDLLDFAWDGFKRFVTVSLYPDGRSLDLERRDTLTYHCSALRPLNDLAILAAHDGVDLYNWDSPSGSSLAKSVAYVVPFATGEKVRREWTNTKVDLDRRRAAEGLADYQPGKLFDPKDALRVLAEASFFDPSLVPVVQKLAGSGESRFPTWRAVLNEAAQSAVKK